MPDDVRTSVWQGSFTLFGVELQCHLLDDGQRVIEADSMAALHNAMAQPDMTIGADEEVDEFACWLHSQEIPK